MELNLSEGTGILHPSRIAAPRLEEPLLKGTVCFDITERWHVSVLRTGAEAWLDMTAARLRYRLSVGGLPGWMNHRMRIAGAGPDYVGMLGHNDELQIAGWRTGRQARETPSVTLMIYSSSLGNALLERLLARSLGLRG